MSSTRQQQGSLLTNDAFIQQVTGSLIAMAYSVITEATTVTNHANRAAFANAIIGNPAAQAAYMLPGIIPYANILNAAGTPASIADADVDARVQTVYNWYANQYAAQVNTGATLQLGG